MSNPFKVGDKVVLTQYEQKAGEPGVFEITKVYGMFVDIDRPVRTVCDEDLDQYKYHADHFRAAIAGQDYPINNGPLEYNPNTGHLPDGSGVQKHSAGPLYPCVIAMRDGRLGGKYDYGVLSPRNQEPLWLSNHEAAVQLALIIKEDLS